MKAPTTEIDCLSIYERMAATYFNDLKQPRLNAESLTPKSRKQKTASRKPWLKVIYASGKTPKTKNSFYYEDTCYVFCPGRVTYDYSHCEDVVAAEDNLREVKSMAAATGLVQQKQGKPFWSVR